MLFHWERRWYQGITVLSAFSWADGVHSFIVFSKTHDGVPRIKKRRKAMQHRFSGGEVVGTDRVD